MQPPGKIIQFLRWFCREDYIEEIEGDLVEVFKKDYATSPRKAHAKFALSVIRYVRPQFIKRLKISESSTTGMYSNYLKVGWRSLIRNGGYSVINITGLAIGMTIAILNGVWIWHEFSFNKYHDNYERIAQVGETGLDPERNGTFLGTTMTYPLATELIGNYRQQFKRISRASSSFQGDKILAAGETKILSPGLYTDPDMLAMLSLKMLSGNWSALSEKHSIVIAQSVADALFGTQDPINEVITLDNRSEVMVTGVFEDLPQNTEFERMKFFAPWSLFLEENPWIEKRALNDWRNHFIKIFVEIPEGKTFDEVIPQIKGALQFAPEDIEGARARKQELTLYAMSDWHLYPPNLRGSQMQPILMLKMVGAIGFFVLVLACINFINLSTARAEKRAKEVGIRKTIGSGRGQLVSHFFYESFLVVIFAFLAAVALSLLAMPAFSSIASQNIEIPWGNPWFWAACLAFIVVTSLLAGSYPAIHLSSFNPVRALKGNGRAGRGASLPRRMLVVFQFSISVVLTISTVVVFKQIQFAKNRPVGYDRQGLIMMPKRSDAFKGKYEILRNELKRTGTVSEVSESMGPATEIYSGNNGWDWKGRNPDYDESFATLSVSHLHGKTIGWKIIQGRDFDPDIPADSLGIVINESALAIMGLNAPIGEPVSWTWWVDKSKVFNYTILGVVEDMVMESPYLPAEPTIFFIKGHNGSPSWLNVRIRPDVALADALPKVESVFRKIVPSVPFQFSFADDQYAKKFGKEETMGKLASIFAALAILISCLGLLGLASYVTETRTKEIGVRKVLGATVIRLWRMLSSDFVWLVLIACCAAAPIAWYLMSNWLANFPYRTDLSAWVFLVTVIGAVVVTFGTVSYQAIRTALMNPVNCLRTE